MDRPKDASVAKMYYFNSDDIKKSISLEYYIGEPIPIPTCRCKDNVNFYKLVLIRKADVNKLDIKAVLGFNLNHANLETTIDKSNETCHHCGHYALWVRTDKNRVVRLGQKLIMTEKTRPQLNKK